MPRLGQRKDEEGIPTYLRLPKNTRDKLEAAIGQPGIKTLTDAVVAAADLLEKSLKKPTKRTPKGTS